jgi:hypothetical protein
MSKLKELLFINRTSNFSVFRYSNYLNPLQTVFLQKMSCSIDSDKEEFNFEKEMFEKAKCTQSDSMAFITTRTVSKTAKIICTSNKNSVSLLKKNFFQKTGTIHLYLFPPF